MAVGSKPSVIVVLALIVMLGKALLAQHDVTPQAASVIRRWVISDYDRYHQARKDITPEDRVALSLAASQMRLRSISARGRAAKMEFKAVIEPNAAHPPSMAHVQYFTMRYSPVTGWDVPIRSTAMFYFLALFFV